MSYSGPLHPNVLHHPAPKDGPLICSRRQRPHLLSTFWIRRCLTDWLTTTLRGGQWNTNATASIFYSTYHLDLSLSLSFSHCFLPFNAYKRTYKWMQHILYFSVFSVGRQVFMLRISLSVTGTFTMEDKNNLFKCIQFRYLLLSVRHILSLPQSY